MATKIEDREITEALERWALKRLCPWWRLWSKRARELRTRIKRQSLQKAVLSNTARLWLKEVEREKPWSIDEVRGAK